MPSSTIPSLLLIFRPSSSWTTQQRRDLPVVTCPTIEPNGGTFAGRVCVTIRGNLEGCAVVGITDTRKTCSHAFARTHLHTHPRRHSCTHIHIHTHTRMRMPIYTHTQPARVCKFRLVPSTDLSPVLTLLAQTPFVVQKRKIYSTNPAHMSENNLREKPYAIKH
jgi:hypothetical protein